MKAEGQESGRKGQSILVASLLLCLLVLFPYRVGAVNSGGEERDLSDLRIEDLMGLQVATVYGASKFEQKVTDAPSSISIVTSDDIKKFGYRTLADILRSQRSFYITNDRNYQYAGIRGFSRPGDYNTRILLLVDGHRTNDNIYNQVMVGNEFILDVDLIDRVEIIRGPGSSLYGSNAFFGVINVITRRGRDVGGMEVAASAESWDTYSARATFGEKFDNGLEALISATGYRSRGQSLYFKEFDDPQTNNGWADHNDEDDAPSMFIKAAFKNLSLESAFISRKKEVPTAAWGTVFNNGQDETIDKRWYLDLTYNKMFGNSLDVLARLYYDYYRYDGYYLFDNPPPYINRDISIGNWWGTELTLTRRLGSSHLVTVGGEYENNVRQFQENHDRGTGLTYLRDNRRSEVFGLYIQDEIILRENLTLSAGLRYDHYSTFGGSTNPRLALVYTPFPMTVVKALYGQAFRAPNAYELYYNDGNIESKANPSLDPERITNYELVFEKYFSNSLRFAASGFYYRGTDIITAVLDTDDLIVFKNTGTVVGKGLELEVEKTWSNEINLRFSQSFQYVKDEETRKRAVNSPASLSKLNLTVPIVASKLYGGLEAQYVSRRDKLQGGSVPSYWVTNLTLLARNVIKNLELSGSVYNLFDQTVKDPTSSEFRQTELVQDGISFRIKACYRF